MTENEKSPQIFQTGDVINFNNQNEKLEVIKVGSYSVFGAFISLDEEEWNRKNSCFDENEIDLMAV